MELSFVILTWNSQKDIGVCLDSIIASCTKAGIDHEIFVVDNGSSDNTPTILKNYESKNSSIKCTYFYENKGTTFPRNIALKQVRSKYICILDSDTEFLEGDINAMLRYFESDATIGLIAPKLVLRDGSIQNSVKKFPTFMEKLLKIKRILKLDEYHVSDFYQNFPFSKVQDVDTAISACWFMPSVLLKEVGYLDEKIFYSPEDIDYCLRIWKSGKKIIYYPHLTILHKTQQISHKKPFSKITLSHFFGLLYFYRKSGYWLSRKKIYRKLKITNPLE
jgi:GT2 family glycosyltransferase